MERRLNLDFKKALAGVTALAAVLVALSKASGAFDQMQRNEPDLSAAAFSATVLAGILILVAGAVEDSDIEWTLAGLGLGLFLFASVTAVVVVVLARGERPPPTITATLTEKPQLMLSGTVQAHQMSAKGTLKVLVNASGSRHFNERNVVLDATIGADSSGNASLPLRVPLAASRYRWLLVRAWFGAKPSACGATAEVTRQEIPGCLMMRLPAAQATSG